jgi:AraC-like DNA-binding protein
METILCERRTYANKPYTHAHDYGQLVIPIHGALSISVGPMTADKQQHVVYVPPATAHSFYARAANQFFVFDAPVCYLPQGLQANGSFYALDGRWQAIRHLLAEEVGDGPASSQRLADLFRYISGLLASEAEAASLTYIKRHFAQRLTLEQLAAIEHFNSTYYVEWFKRKYGLSPMVYIRDLRFRKAQELLIHTDYTIMQIAQQIGYENQATLTRLFQSQSGMTPREYRDKNRKRVK